MGDAAPRSVSSEGSAPAPSPPVASPPAPAPPAPVSRPPSAARRRAAYALLILALIGLVAWWRGPAFVRSWGTISTDDAYVNGHATFVAARVPGQVSEVVVDDNQRVRKGDTLVRLDGEPYQVALNIAQASLESAEADVAQALAQARAIEGQMRSARFALQRAVEDADTQASLLRSRVANLELQRATLARVESDYERVLPLAQNGSVSQEEIDHRKLSVREAEARAEEALQLVHQARVSLGLPVDPPGGNLAEVPEDLSQTFSGIRQAQANLIEAAAHIGVVQPFDRTPKQMIEEFYKRDPSGDIDKIYDALLQEAPIVKQARAKLMLARRNLDEAALNLRYCAVVAEIDGVVVRRNVHPGNNVLAGQELMVVRSITDIWVDANFKETQLAKMRIGQPVDIDVDMYGASQRFKGRISGFAMGTGSTLALLPPENATGNFVKVVQRLPVRIDLVGYDPEQKPLFVGLSVTPRVQVRAAPTGPNSGAVLQHEASQPPGAPAPSGKP